jgi:hypothetical protein
MKVEGGLIRSIGGKTYEPFQRVEARFQAGRSWALGKIINVREDGNYDIEYDNGEEEYRVMPELIRPFKG